MPGSAGDHLPAHAREIYRTAFNSAWPPYADPSKRRGKVSREETAHRVAWAAVERIYQKDAKGRWRRKPG